MVKNKIFLFFFIISLICFGLSCKTHQKSEAAKTTKTDSADNRTIGIVSHKYKANGCGSVIIIQSENDNQEVVLIPKDPLPKEVDKDGAKIKFNYRRLRMPNPIGCSVGGMVEITDINVK